jgi:ketosteroid isomerase-like protein
VAPAESEDAKLVRNAYRAWNDGGPSAMRPFVTEDVVYHDPPDLPDATTLNSADEVIETWGERMRMLTITINPAEILDGGEGNLVVVLEISMRGSDSGIPWDEVHYHAVQVRGGKIVEGRIFRDRPRALEAAGLPAD